MKVICLFQGFLFFKVPGDWFRNTVIYVQPTGHENNNDLLQPGAEYIFQCTQNGWCFTTSGGYNILQLVFWKGFHFYVYCFRSCIKNESPTCIHTQACIYHLNAAAVLWHMKVTSFLEIFYWVVQLLLWGRPPALMMSCGYSAAPY